ncbi:helix-turn-helix domain-containing protein [Parafrankia sp. BMG5.11]|uniref:helix-turn-helix domain-containing protein n=1 Tax=Parafrankia sp. BMG5.11 TaxID=222540 RepID=UPI00103F3A27|nr:helix-turn-helix domain-containing protein [Parafrankia sp. BMG5.11]TCJ37380.1 DNA-binding protein [Parafrankia sp. BMG5.11]
MPARRVDPRRIKQDRPYAVEEAARALDVHANTVRRWIDQGLPALTSKRPTLILGRELRAFLVARRKRLKRPCQQGTIYCFKCREPRRPALGMVDFMAHSATGGNLKALCEDCGTVMHQRVARAAIALKMPGVDVQYREAEPRLTGSAPAPLYCDNREDRQHHG